MKAWVERVWLIKWYRGSTVQKKTRRRIQGLVRPIICPRCRTYTRQAPKGPFYRICLPCGSTFTPAESRQAHAMGRSSRWRMKLAVGA